VERKKWGWPVFPPKKVSVPDNWEASPPEGEFLPAVLNDGEFVVRPERVSSYNAQVPSFEGIGDTMGFDGMNFGIAVCAYCGSSSGHKAGCASLSRNYGSSLQTQRAMTDRLREEMDRNIDGAQPTRAQLMEERPVEPKDERTDVQKRFAAIAEELEDGKNDK